MAWRGGRCRAVGWGVVRMAVGAMRGRAVVGMQAVRVRVRVRVRVAMRVRVRLHWVSWQPSVVRCVSGGGRGGNRRS